jgi:flagellar biosynthesis GTPase FlhF
MTEGSGWVQKEKDVAGKEGNPQQTGEAARKRETVEPVGRAPVLLQEQIPPLTMGVQRAVLDPGRAGPADILALQRLVGNRAVSRLIQTKLTVGPPGDRYEQEADRVAEQVMGMPSRPPAVQRQEEEEELQTKPVVQRQEEEEEVQMRPLVQRQEEEEEVQTKPVVQRQEEEEEEVQMRPLVQRQEEEEEVQMRALLQRQEEEEEVQMRPLVQRQEEEEELQTRPLPSAALPTAARGTGRTGLQRRDEGGFEADPQLEGRLAADRGGGNPLPEETRAFMEPRFGADFGGVRVHTGSEAAQMSSELSAQAFTHGQDIYLGAGRYDPGTTAGKRLLAHELTHVVQQTGLQLKGEKITASRGRAPTLQRTLTSRSTRAFTTVGDREHEDPSGDTRYEGYTYSQLKDATDSYMPTGEQGKLTTVRGAFRRMWKSPEAEKRLKDVLRAFLLGMYAARLDKLEKSTTDVGEKKKKRSLYYTKALEAKNMYAPLVKKGVDASETRSFLQEQGFADLVAGTVKGREKELAKGPRIDVRSTYIGGKILGQRVRAHLFIVYTGSDGKQWYFRGGPDQYYFTVAHMGPYVPGTVDWDPSAPSKTVLKGEAAGSKVDALAEATSVIDGMKVPYKAGGMFESGENCNATAWTILTRAGVPTGKPSGRHPGWGHILGAKTKGKEKALPPKEDDSGPGKDYVVSGKPEETVQVFEDRLRAEKATTLAGGTAVRWLADYGSEEYGVSKIRYQGDEIGFVARGAVGPPRLPGRPFQASIYSDVYQLDSKATIGCTLDAGDPIEVLDPSYKSGDAMGDLIHVRFMLLENEVEGRIPDWNIEERTAKVEGEHEEPSQWPEGARRIMMKAGKSFKVALASEKKPLTEDLTFEADERVKIVVLNELTVLARCRIDYGGKTWYGRLRDVLGDPPGVMA